MFSFDSGVFVPMMIFALPIVAVAGGITAGIVKTISRHRLIELAQRERIAACRKASKQAWSIPRRVSAQEDAVSSGNASGSSASSAHCNSSG